MPVDDEDVPVDVMGSGWRSVLRLGRGSDGNVTKPFSLAFKQKMVEQLTGKARCRNGRAMR